MDVIKSTVDFYVLESLHAEMAVQDYSKVHGAIVAKLRNDLTKERTRHADGFALALRDYLFVASCGEARHASGKCIPSFVGQGGRDDVYHVALDYAPTAENWQRLQDVFAQDGWASSYGGEAWRNICEHAAMFDTLPSIAYVDHVIDLAHNGGCAFNKPVEDVLDFRYLYHYDASDPYCGQRSNWFTKFLNYKFSAASLALQDAGDLNTMMRVHTSGRVKGLVRQFCNVFRLELPVWIEHYADGDLCQEYKAAGWQYETLPALEEKHSVKSSKSYYHVSHSRYGNCDGCGCRLGEDKGYYDGCMSTYCESCFSDNFTWCAKCGETISHEDAVMVGGDDYCEWCADKVGFKCRVCRHWAKNDTGDGSKLCERCENDYTTCYDCEDVVSYDDVKEYDDGYYCRYCWHSKIDKPCSGCNKSYAPDELVEDKCGDLYCEHCATVCDSCKVAVGKTKNGQGWISNHMTPVVYGRMFNRKPTPYVTGYQFGSDALYCRKCAASVGQKGKMVLHE